MNSPVTSDDVKPAPNPHNAPAVSTPGDPNLALSPQDAPAALTPEDSELDPAIAARLKRNADGLVPAVVQEHSTGDVLMMAWMNDKALAYTLATRKATYWSRSRREFWTKGLTSGHVQHVREVRLDCDGDTILLVVDQTGGACHTGDHTCFDADQLLADG